MITRLKKRPDFVRVSQNGTAFPARSMILQVFFRPNLLNDRFKIKGLRIGFTATRKIGGAVLRNKAKRRLRCLAEIYLKKYTDMNIDIVMIARVKTHQSEFDGLIRDIIKNVQLIEDHLLKITVEKPLEL
jgi:ribonuclease P protein component